MDAATAERSIELQRIRSLEQERIRMGRQIDELLADNLALERARGGWIQAALKLDELLEYERRHARHLEQAWRSQIDTLTAECVRLRAELACARSKGGSR